MEKQGLIKLLPLLAALSALPAQSQEDEEFFEFDEEASAAPAIADPLESLNRASFAVNDKLYRGVLKPIARGLRVLPVPVRNGMANFFTNLLAPVSAACALLQGEPRNAAIEASRFVLNTTAGLGGLLDPATHLGLLQDEEDVGQTLARYGVGHGFYLVVPLYGPTSLRDMAGSITNNRVNPFYQNLVTGEIIGINLAAAEVDLSLDQDTYEAFYESALDPYVFFRSAWVQNRQGKIDQ